MRLLKFLLSLIATVGLIYVLSTSMASNGKQTPAFGDLLNPFSGFWQNGIPASANYSLEGFPKTIQSKLSGAVTVEFDDREVPHIFADNDKDAIFIQGFLHAQNRLFQMDIATRSASGRLSEVIASEKAFESDQNKRRYGMLWAAENALKGWKKDTVAFKLLESYVAGVNAYIESLDEKNIPVEYKIIGFKPEPWTPLKTALFFKAMCETLARGDLDVDASNALSVLGESDFNKIFPDFCPDQKPIVPSGTSWNFKAGTNTPKFPPASLTDTYQVDNDVEHPEGIGSNNWVVGPQKTANGKPILCGDPHLNLTLPSIWYELQITTPTLNAYGVSLPGIPFIVIGFNNNIAWTQTNGMQDVAEWYKLKWKDNSHEQYELDGKWVNVQHKIEEYHVKGKGIIKDDVKYTVFGPVVSEDGAVAHSGLAYRWICHDESTDDITLFYKLNQAKDYSEFIAALSKYSFPIQNFAFASNTGDYAIYTQGRLPIMAKGAGRFVSDGTNATGIWKGDIPFEQMPHVKNHPQGFVASANQNQTDPTYPYDYHSYQFETVRSRYIHRKLTEAQKVTVEDMKKMQNDVYSLEAEENLPIMLANVDGNQLNAAAKTALNEMKGWKYSFTKDSKGAMYYDIWSSLFRKFTWDELKYDVPKTRYLRPKPFATIRLLKDENNSKYFDMLDTPEKEDGKTVLTKSLNFAMDSLAKKMITNPTLDYSSYRNTAIGHIGLIPGFGRENVATGGNGYAINCMKQKHGPSWRMIVETGDTPKAYIVYPGGQTGNPGAKHYDQFVDTWASGEYYEALYLKKPNEGNARIVKTFSFSATK